MICAPAAAGRVRSAAPLLALVALASLACSVNDIDALRFVPPGAADAGTAASDSATATAEAGNVCASADPVGPSGSYVPRSYQVACGTRDAFSWPFSKNSIWNIPIGGDAVYVATNLGTLGACNVNNDLVYREASSDPAVEVIRPDHQSGVDGQGGTGKYIHLPDLFLYKAAPINAASFFDVNGHTFKEFSAFSRETAGATATGWDFGTNEIDGQSPNGGYGNSHLSVIGGTLRPGELTSPAPIHHVLKIGLDWVKLSPDWPGKYRWPALSSDGDGNNTYSGALKALAMGALVAIPPDVDLSAVPWKTPIGRKIAEALVDYGAYVVSATADSWQWPNGGYTMAISAQNEAISEVKATFGIDWASSWGGGGDAWTADMQQIYERLAVIDNNVEASPGGGGIPRRPLAPDFAASFVDAGAALDSAAE